MPQDRGPGELERAWRRRGFTIRSGEIPYTDDYEWRVYHRGSLIGAGLEVSREQARKAAEKYRQSFNERRKHR